MKTYRQLVESLMLAERVLSIGLNPAHEKYREQHRQEIHDMLHTAYSKIGGYGGIKSGSKEESAAIHKDIDNSMIKAVRRNGKITAVNLYKDQHGRKTIASATDRTEQGKADWMKTRGEDIKQKRAWGEVSGKPAHLMQKLGAPIIPNKEVGALLGKNVTPDPDGQWYTREIGGHPHKKIAVGFPRK